MSRSPLAGPFARRVKRAVDIAVSAAGLVVTAPVLAAAVVAVRIDLGAPVFFRQERPGLGEKPFELVKLKTMRDANDARGVPISDPKTDAARLTPLGRFLRRWSIDELPQLWNVLRGDMSLVGPRPLLMRYLPRYSAEQRRRHEVPPGITGWAQVNGRNAVTWKQRFEADVWYVDHWSLALDAKILAMTARRVFKSEGISLEGHATMPEFGLADTPV